MEKENNNTKILIEYLKSKNFQYTVDYNPSEAKIALIKARIAKTKKERDPNYVFTIKNGVEVKGYLNY